MLKSVKLSKENNSALVPPKNESKYNDLKIIMSAATHNWMLAKAHEFQNAQMNRDQTKLALIEQQFKLLFSD